MSVREQALLTVQRARRAILDVPEPYVDMLEVYWSTLETARAVGCTEEELAWPDEEDEGAAGLDDEERAYGALWAKASVPVVQIFGPPRSGKSPDVFLRRFAEVLSGEIRVLAPPSAESEPWLEQLLAPGGHADLDFVRAFISATLGSPAGRSGARSYRLQIPDGAAGEILVTVSAQLT